jgi:hypothetical protein
MPAIQTELRIQVEGGRIPLLVKRTSLQVSSCEEFSLTVQGVPPAQPPKASTAANRTATKKPAKRLMQATYQPTLSNVRFVAIYDGGQGTGLKVKVGKGKLAPLTQPLVYLDRAATGLGSRPRIILENESATPRTAFMLVGSDLPKAAHSVQLVERPAAAVRGNGAATKKHAAKQAAKAKGAKKITKK